MNARICSQVGRSVGGWGTLQDMWLASEVRADLWSTLPLTCGVWVVNVRTGSGWKQNRDGIK